MRIAMKRIGLAVAVLGLMAGAAGEADAGLVTQAGSLNYSLSSWAGHSQPISGTVIYDIQRFDPTLGNLDAITIEFTDLAAYTNSSIRLDNESASPTYLRTSLNAQFRISAGLAETPSVSRTGVVSSNERYLAADSDWSPNFTGDDSAYAYLNSASGFGTLTKVVEQAAFSQFTGSGVASIGLKARFAPVFTPMPGWPQSPAPAYLFTGPVYYTGAYKVNYEYTAAAVAAVPEPSTLAGGILGVALMGGAWLRRRKHQAS